MGSPRHTSPVILAFAILAGCAFLLQQTGFFNGIFSTDILASVKAEDILSASDIAAMERPAVLPMAATNIDPAETASVR
ncbi:hypothetical protein GCM10010520_46790 [Rhizobium viscosum]|uniref:Uncharacterized protein n=1 Tax=Rhizobium viscosum TaxID=1673 RepID=A0ABR9J1Z8_RHIVS|nr:hypothetical protein [Rhizobium viscosum]MBE1509450.1 hypothetical protein [Rhizobium viscosum]